MAISTIAENLSLVDQRIATACERAGRDLSEVRLLPVSKTHPAHVLREAMEAGCTQFGENRVQEMVAKAAELDGTVSWVLIGHLQRNKVAQACGVMSEMQSLDSLDLATAVDHRLALSGKTLETLIEVNSSGEESKFGVEPSDVMSFSSALRDFPHLNVTGLMTVAHPDLDKAERGFAMMRDLRDRLRDRDGGGWDELSMGMSGDFETAICYGSTCVRVGTAIFGTRDIQR